MGGFGIDWYITLTFESALLIKMMLLSPMVATFLIFFHQDHRCKAVYSGYQSPPTTFWWTSIKCIHDNNSEQSHGNRYFNVNSQSIRVALSSLLESSIKRNWEVRLTKLLEAPFRSSRSWAMF